MVRVVSYHRTAKDLGLCGRSYDSVDDENESRITELYYIRLPAFAPRLWVVAAQSPPVTGLGILDGLPNELVLGIAQMDIQTALRFRGVNRRAYDLVSNQLATRAVIQHAHAALMTSLDIGLARFLTFEDIYRAMLRPRCESCGEPAAYIYLLTATKACEHCLATKPCFETVTISSFAKAAKCTVPTLQRQLPVAKVIADKEGVSFRWGPSSTIHRNQSQFKMVNAVEASRIRALQGNISDGQFRINRKLQRRAMVSAQLPTFDAVTRRVHRPLGCKGCLLQHGGDRYWASTLSLNDRPRYDRHFAICTKNYTKVEFLKHVETCQGAQSLWRLTRGGTVRLPLDVEEMVAENRGILTRRGGST